MTSYIGEIRMFAGNFAPAGWAFCDGSLIPISVNETLFNLIGTTYGGDGISTFALPDLRGRIPIHMGSSFILGEMAGTELVTLTVNQIPAHSHPMQGTAQTANTQDPSNAVPANSVDPTYAQATTQFGVPTTVTLTNKLSSTGGSQPHDNMMPSLCLNFIISLFGIFPSPT